MPDVCLHAAEQVVLPMRGPRNHSARGETLNLALGELKQTRHRRNRLQLWVRWHGKSFYLSTKMVDTRSRVGTLCSLTVIPPTTKETPLMKVREAHVRYTT